MAQPSSENPNYRILPISFERGLTEQLEQSMIPVGSAARMRNWEPSPAGEARTRTAWSKGSTTSQPSSKRGKGIGHLATSSRPKLVQRKIVTFDLAAGASKDFGSASFDATITAGNLVVARVVVADSIAGAPTIAVNSTFSVAIEVEGVAGEASVGIYYKENATAVASVTNPFNASSANTKSAIVEYSEYSGIATSSSLDITASQGTNAHPITVTAASDVTQPGELYLALAGKDSTSGSFRDWTDAFVETTDTTFAGNANVALGTADKLGTVIETVTYSVSNTVDIEAAALATFKPATDTSNTTGYYFATVDDNTDSYDVYKIDRSNVSAGTWSSFDSVTVSDRTLPVAFTSGLGALFYTHPAFTTVRYWDQLTAYTPAYIPQDVTGTNVYPSAGRCIAFHKDRLFVGGSSATPSRIRYSNTGDFITWEQNNYIDVGLDDGEYIEDITPFEDSLIIGKQTSLWVLTGSGIDSFVLKKYAVGGIAPGRTLMPTPYGCIAAGRKHVWLISNGNVSLISRPISSSYGMTGSYMTTSYINDVAYICDSATGNIWAVNLQTGTWWEERMPTNEGPSIIFNHDYNQLMQPLNATTGAVMNYRQFPGSSRTKDFDTLTETFSLYTPQYFPEGPEYAISPRHLFLKLRQHGGDTTDVGVTVTPIYDGTSGTAKTFTPHASAGVYRERFDLGEHTGIYGVQFQLDQVMANGDVSALDIEEASLGYIRERVR